MAVVPVPWGVEEKALFWARAWRRIGWRGVAAERRRGDEDF